MNGQPSDDAKKMTALMGLALNYGKEFSESLLEIWLDLLANYSPQQVSGAVKSVIEHYEFKTLPPFAVLKKALDELTGTSEKAIELQAQAEWGVLTREIERVGSYGSPNVHPTTAHVVRLMGGWGQVCQWPLDSYDFKRQDFLRLWADTHGRVEHMQLGAPGILAALGLHVDGLPSLPAPEGLQ